MVCVSRVHFKQRQFAVGYQFAEYPDYRPMRQADLMNVQLRERMLKEHADNGGWELLESPLLVRGNRDGSAGVRHLMQSML